MRWKVRLKIYQIETSSIRKDKSILTLVMCKAPIPDYSFACPQFLHLIEWKVDREFQSYRKVGMKMIPYRPIVYIVRMKTRTKVIAWMIIFIMSSATNTIVFRQMEPFYLPQWWWVCRCIFLYHSSRRRSLQTKKVKKCFILSFSTKFHWYTPKCIVSF